MAPVKTSDSASSNPVPAKPSAGTTTPVTELEATKFSILKMDPFKVLVVGIDFGGPGDPGYDERVKLPLDPMMVQSIKKWGVVRTILARKDGDRFVAVDGRRRIMHARAANLELQAENPSVTADQLIRVKVELVRNDEVGLMATSRVANAYAVKDNPITNAKHAQQMLDKGADMPTVALAFGVSVQSVGDWLKLLDVAPEVAAELEKGMLTANAAIELSGVPMAEQVKILQKVRDEAMPARGSKPGKVSTSAVTAAVRDAKTQNGTGAKLKKTPSERIKAVCGVFEGLLKDAVKATDPHGPLPSDTMYSALRRMHLILTDTKWDSAVKAAVKAATPPTEDEAA